ncbi:MAG: hypothetical protein FWF99_04800 [Desulfovibrionaceae bacterium]|nr:hypothetical protein [Desulfovibrionaceae bacterium]
MKKICLALLFLFALPSNAFAYDVMFNTKSRIYHTPSCGWARKCTKNCIKIDHTQAQQRGGVPCKVCGGVKMSGNSKNLNGGYAKTENRTRIGPYLWPAPNQAQPDPGKGHEPRM